MCLTVVDKKIRKGNGVGYKVFSIDRSYHLVFPYWGGRIKYDYWYVDKSRRLLRVSSDRDEFYPAGYHIYPKLEDAQDYVEGWYGGWKLGIRRVEYQDVVASGREGSKLVIVAHKLLIHKKGE